MAFDGVFVNKLVKEISDFVVGGIITKINMPLDDKIIFTIKNGGSQRKLLLSSNPSLPIIYFTEEELDNPKEPPMFCMFLRKYFKNSKILSVNQMNFDRVIEFTLTSKIEFSVENVYKLYIEMMGKHSNIIIVDENDNIVDSIKKVGLNLSSIRQVYKGQKYFIPNTKNKENPLLITKNDFFDIDIETKDIVDELFKKYIGISKISSSEIVDRTLKKHLIIEKENLYNIFENYLTNDEVFPSIYFDVNNKPVDFSHTTMSIYEGLKVVKFNTLSEVLEEFYKKKNEYLTINQRGDECVKVVNNIKNRLEKKYDILEKQLLSTKDMDKIKLKAELLQANSYRLEPSSKVIVENYYDNNKPLEIVLDKDLTIMENVNKFYDRYNKLKRTKIATIEQIEILKGELNTINEISNSLEISKTITDIEQINYELMQLGYIKRKKSNKKINLKSSYLKYKTSSGLDVYVGKNNYQNEELTLKKADKMDMWFHIKSYAGSHVILKFKNTEFSETDLLEAAQLAAFYSKASVLEKVEVDYTLIKNIKKPSNGKIGMVIYHKYNSMVVTKPEKIELLKQ